MTKIIHGNSNLGFAPIEMAGVGSPKFGTPVMIPGLVSTEIEVEQPTKPIYADNEVVINVKGAKVRKASIKVTSVPEAYAPYLGFKKQTNGMLTDTGSFANHCIFFETIEEDGETGKATQVLHYLYSVTASEPKIETNTDEDEVENQEIEIEYQAKKSSIAKDADGFEAQYGSIVRTEQNSTLYDKFKEQVILPTASVA